MAENDTDKRSGKETAKRRDETLKRMHKMPPKPHSEIKGKRKKAQSELAKQQSDSEADC